MGTTEEVILFLVRCKRCLELFVICRSCYRGHVYCGEFCRTQARREGKRKSNREYQSTPEGQFDHRERQRKCRQAKRDQEIAAVGLAPIAKTSGVTDNVLKDRSAVPACARPSRPQPKMIRPVCSICGKGGRWVSQFEMKRRQRK